MKTYDEYRELIEQLRDEDNCDVLDCIEEAADAIEKLIEALDESRGAASQYYDKLRFANEELRNITANGVFDPCQLCAHCCIDGEPAYMPGEKYMEHCYKCDKDCSEFVWRGMI